METVEGKLKGHDRQRAHYQRKIKQKEEKREGSEIRALHKMECVEETGETGKPKLQTSVKYSKNKRKP